MNGLMTTEPLTDRFRCPSEFLRLTTADQLSSDAGFFQFGANIVCYGRSSNGWRSSNPSAPLCDVLAVADSHCSELQLPFDLVEVIENLREERYVDSGGKARGSLTAAYYLLRPLLALSLRKHLQRFRLRGWDRIPFPHWPIDTTVEQLLDKTLALCMRAQGIKRVPFIWFWPNGAEAALAMTHDIETAAGRDFCSALMDLDSSFGIPSSFHVIPEERYEVSSAFLNSIRDRGFEVNIHDLNHDGNLYRDRDTFLKRAKRINTYAKAFGAFGFRSGALYRNLNWHHALAFSYDMSVPNVGHLDPQQGGCCTVMPFQIGNILELPLTTTQDHTLFNILGQYSLDLWKQQIAGILKAHGLISFNIHPDYIIPVRARRCYASLLEYLGRVRDEEQIWVARPGEIAAWWKQRTQLRLVNERGEWQIRGAGSERACLAWAVLEDNNDIVYVKEVSQPDYVSR